MERRGELWVCLLPGNEAVSMVHNLFMFPSSHFCPSDRSKAAFPEALSWKPEGGPNLILRSSNIPQSNITRLRSYHIQRERAIFFHHSSLLSLFQSSTNASLFFLSQGFPLLLDRMKGLQSSADAQFHHEAGGSSKSVLWGK